jgi:hypothetical protein
MAIDHFVLRENPSPDDTEWVFTNIPDHLLKPPPSRSGRLRVKLISFSPEKIELQVADLSSNRVVHHEPDPSKIVMASFSALRFKDMKPSVASEYIVRMFKAGLFLNGIQYRFFGHGNSQLVWTTLQYSFKI